MTSRRAAVAWVVLAALLYLGVARPRGAAILSATDEYARLRRNLRETQARIEVWENQAAKLADAQEPAASAKAERPLTHVRKLILSTLAGARIVGVQLQVRSDSQGGLIRAHLSAEGDFVDLGRLAGRLTQPGTGLILERVVLKPATSGAALELDVVSIGGGS